MGRFELGRTFILAATIIKYCHDTQYISKSIQYFHRLALAEVSELRVQATKLRQFRKNPSGSSRAETIQHLLPKSDKLKDVKPRQSIRFPDSKTWYRTGLRELYDLGALVPLDVP